MGHGLIYAVALLALLLFHQGRRLRATGRDDAIVRPIGFAAALLFIAYVIYYLGWREGGIARNLPLQLCDILNALVPVALLTRWRPARTLVYFWGIGLSTQAIFTPTGEHRLDDPRFWIFWSTHFLILFTALWEVTVRGYRPTRRDLLTALAAGWLYLALILPLNIAFGWNYGFTGDSLPGTPSLLDVLGPWPWRVLVMGALASAVQILLWAVWKLPGLNQAPQPATKPL